MRWPWRKKKPKSETWAARREREIRHLENLVASLYQLHEVRPHEMRKLRDECAELRQQLKEAKQNQRLMAQHIQELQLSLSVYEPGPPPRPSVSDEDYDAMLARFAEEDARKGTRGG